MRENLFSNWWNSLLTVVLLAVMQLGHRYIFCEWVFFTADWRPVLNNPLLYLVGQYPRGELWRLGTIVAIISALMGVSWQLWGGVIRTLAFTYAIFYTDRSLLAAATDTLPITMRLFFAANVVVVDLGSSSPGSSSCRRVGRCWPGSPGWWSAWSC